MKNHRIVGFVASCFDLMHAGHCLMLKDAKKHCDYLIVALQSDPTIDRPEKNKPIMTMEERIIIVESNKYVDEIRTYDTEKDLAEMLKELRPDLRILGSDYVGKKTTGQSHCRAVYYHNRDHEWSTSELRRRVAAQL
jgi:glycerol-3-phosphate cytidylyltransferase